jgi:KUP system potassium uptake protein
MPRASIPARLAQSRTLRVPGLAIFLTGNPDSVPAARHVRHRAEPRMQRRSKPNVGSTRKNVHRGIYRVILNHGFMGSPNVPTSSSS